MPVKITLHAFERAFKRFDWGRTYMKKVAVIAFEKGIDSNSAKDKLKKYIEEREEKYKGKKSVKVMAKAVFIFQNKTLVTVFELPIHLRPYCDYSKQHLNTCPAKQT